MKIDVQSLFILTAVFLVQIIGISSKICQDSSFVFRTLPPSVIIAIVSSCSKSTGLNPAAYLHDLLVSLNGVRLDAAVFSLYVHEWTRTVARQIDSCGTVAGVDMEDLYLSSLALDPFSPIAVKNYAFNLEIRGCSLQSNSLLEQYLSYMNDAGTQLQHAFTSSTYVASEQKASELFSQIVSRSLHMLAQRNPVKYTAHPFFEVRALQASYQYLGISPGIISELYSRVLIHQFPHILDYPKQLQMPQLQQKNDGSRPLRFGIVSEMSQNSSPGLCLTRIFEILLSKHRPRLECVYFDRSDSQNVPIYFGEMMKELCQAVVVDVNDVEASADLIESQRVDILLYISLPTEKFTNMLSMHRLAPVQVQFGIGHPISSGSPAMDYSIVSDLMLFDNSPRPLLSASVLIDSCLEDLLQSNRSAASLTSTDIVLSRSSHSNDMVAGCRIAVPGYRGLAYTEQIVRFESLGYFLYDSMDYIEDKFDPLEFAQSDCSTLSNWLSVWNLEGQLTAEDLGCLDHSNPRSHLYFAMQIPRKLHPSFDEVFMKLIARDRIARIVVMENVKPLLARFAASVNATVESIQQNFVFVRRMPISDYLRLLSVSSVFLNPFPFGAGITSSDALSMCVPVVILPSHISVLQMALGQIRALGDEFVSAMIARDVDDYVSKAIRFAADSEERRRMRRMICESKAQRLFGDEVAQHVVDDWERFLFNL